MYDDDRKRGGDRDRGKLSWKEIDALRDKSRARERDPMQKSSSPAALAAQKSYKAALERAFAAGKLDELARTLQRTNEPALPAAQPRQPNGAGGGATGEPPPDANATPPPPPDDGATNGAAAGATAANGTSVPAPAPIPAAPKDPERENRMKMMVRIRESEGRDLITKAVDAYLARWNKLPEDYEVLTKTLSHKNDDRVREALDCLESLIPRDKPRRGRTLVAQLRFLEDTHGDPDIRAQAARVRGLLP
jgi:hypothetical protein